MFGSRRKISSNVPKSSEHLWQCLEVIEDFSEIQVIWIQKSHALDLGKAGRYMLLRHLFKAKEHCMACLQISSMCSDLYLCPVELR